VVYPPMPPMPPGPPGTPGGQQLQEALQRQAQAAIVQQWPAAPAAVPDAADVRAAEQRAKAAAAEQVRAAQAAAALRAEEARQEREHAKLVAAQPRTGRPRYDQPRPQVRVIRSQPVRATRSQRVTTLTTFGLWLAVSLISGFLAYKAVSVPSPSGSYATDLWFLGSWFSAVVAAGCFIAKLLDDH
jgi:hypothetical protein